ncbi:PREDICTED: uncharacterized protein LOC106746658 [Dinoponera quadriceps]|uniref:Uncharacterized protein LOC106746658 n=1 Tax=Dinoponera quadriceps TaxID=609295 RepID=A0A6P3XKK9_DINQU|nr:PREDICTED: uncharacterized protein LOC106746658 [Dinoponera quadriceps]
MNKSRPLLTIQIITEYFIGQEAFFYLILMYTSIAICILATVEIATGTMLIGYYKHVCAMFKIASYRIEQAMKTNVQQHIGLRKEIMIRMIGKIIHAVDIHRKAMKSSKYLLTNFEGSFFVLIIFGVISLSLNLFRLESTSIRT